MTPADIELKPDSEPAPKQEPKSRHRLCYVTIVGLILLLIVISGRQLTPGPENVWDPYQSPRAIYGLQPDQIRPDPYQPYFLKSAEQPDPDLVEATIDAAIHNVQNLREWRICYTEAQAKRQLSLDRAKIVPPFDAKGDTPPASHAVDAHRMAKIAQNTAQADIPCVGDDPAKVHYVGFRVLDPKDKTAKTLVISDYRVLGDPAASAENAIIEGMCYEELRAERDKLGRLTPKDHQGNVPSYLLSQYDAQLYLLENLDIRC